MCNIAEERAKIDQLLHDAAARTFERGAGGRDALAEACLRTLYEEYGANCPDRCIENRVETFLLEIAPGVGAVPACGPDAAGDRLL